MIRSILAVLVVTMLSLSARMHVYKERHLGPTGLQGVTSKTSIKITKVMEGSPADGKFKPGDVIVKVGGEKLNTKVRQQLAAAIDLAETKKGRGKLTFTLSDARKVILELPVLGSYSKSAPYKCAKTDAIITRTADALVKSKKYGRQGMRIGLLGLLATGEKKYIKVVRKYLRSADWTKRNYKLKETKAWYLAYTNLLLCEYYLLTKDKYVLPAIKKYSLRAAKGRDGGGLWGHPIATNGRLPGYAQMNCTSAPMFLSLVLATKCGISDPEITACLEQNKQFYQGFVGKGALPYGVHDPFIKKFNDNGKGAPVGLAFAALGNKEGARFFSTLSLAGYDELERGHTGHFFNQLWTGLGANLHGPRATVGFFKKTSWLQTMNRTWDNKFVYDCSAYKKAIFTYRNLSDSGSHLLNFCRSRAKLHITGKDSDKSLWLEDSEVKEVLSYPNYGINKMSNSELLKLFSHPMPQLRVKAIWALREKRHSYKLQIRRMLKGSNKYQKLSACGYYGYGYPAKISKLILEDLMNLVKNPKEDLEVRASAARAIGYAGKDAKKYFADLIDIVNADKPKDPLKYLDGQVARALTALSTDPFADKLIANNDKFYSAINKLLQHNLHLTRSEAGKLISNMPMKHFYKVADNAVAILEDKNNTFHSYHNLGPQTNIMSLLAKLKIEGGMKAAFDLLESKKGKHGFKLRLLLTVLPLYDANAKIYLPKIRKINAGKFQRRWDAMIKKIESAPKVKKLMTMKEARKKGKK